jgi:hypothetical protein
VQSFQEEQADNPASIAGSLLLQSHCGDIETGPASWLVTQGENPASGAILLQQTGEGDVVIQGSVLNHTNHTKKYADPPLISVYAAGGKVTIDGSHLVLDEWKVQQKTYDVTGGLLTLSRQPSESGQIVIQAQSDVTITRDVRGLVLNQPSFAAVTTATNNSAAKGGAFGYGHWVGPSRYVTGHCRPLAKEIMKQHGLMWLPTRM